VIGIFFRALGDLADPRMLAIVVRSLLVSVLIFVALGLALAWGLEGVDPCGWIGAQDPCRLGLSMSGLGAVLLTVAAVWLLFPAVAIGVISAYSDRIAAAVEARHYPRAHAAARPPGTIGTLMLGLRSSGRLLAYNVVALPLYLLLLVTGIGTPIAFLIVNGLAIGRDLGEMVAARHIAGGERRAWLGATRGDRAAIGLMVAAIFLVPIANLFAPVVGAATAVHLFHRRRPPER
jgi:uncharacterized protein involved in cysteine biosynthesis